jgi:PAS domain S-box-containing protein
MLRRFASNLLAEQEAARASSQELKRAKALTEDVINSQPGGIYRIRVPGGANSERDFTYDYVSDSYCALTGLSRERHLSDPKAILELIHPEDRAEFIHRNQVAAATEEPFTWTGRLRRDGQIRFMHFNSLPRLIEDGSTLWTGALMDVTELKRVEAELKQARDAAEEANRAKSEFLANMSHEIRTPLSGVIGMLQLLLQTCDGEREQEYLRTALASSKQLTGLLGDILDLSRIEAGKLVIASEPFSPGELAESARDLFAIAAANKGLELRIECAPDVPPRLVGDAARLRQIVFNLLGNALKFTDTGAVAVSIALGDTKEDGQATVLFQVSDTGVGIPANRMHVIFEPFTQADGSFVRAYQGVGLGLAIVRRLVSLMGGEVNLASTVGKGTTVQVSLPLRAAEAGEGRPEAEVAPAELPPGRKLRLLLVEDEAVNQLSMKLLLAGEGHDVRLARDGRQALEALSGEDFDLVLMDIQMPVMDGLACALNIRSSPEFAAKAKVPIIAMTAHAMDGDKQRFLAAGMNGYVSKPVDMGELKTIMAGLLAEKTAH